MGVLGLFGVRDLRLPRLILLYRPYCKKKIFWAEPSLWVRSFGIFGEFGYMSLILVDGHVWVGKGSKFGFSRFGPEFGPFLYKQV